MALSDAGLTCHRLGIIEPGQLRHHPLRGALFESCVVSEVMKSRARRGLPESLFHFRTAKGLEVDLLIEEGDRLTALEAKSAATVASDFFTPLERLAADVERQLPHLEFDARVIFGGDAAQRRSDATVIPWRRLHDHRW